MTVGDLTDSLKFFFEYRLAFDHLRNSWFLQLINFLTHDFALATSILGYEEKFFSLEVKT